MKNYNYREILINNTISVKANEGLDKTTTKAIVSKTDINEAYIYRFFKNKEDLLAQAFSVLDDELVREAMRSVEVMYIRGAGMETRSRMFFSAMWKFLLGNKERCLAFVRYYYSQYYQKYSAAEHKERFAKLTEKLSVAFKTGSDTWMLLIHILNVMLDFAVRIYEGEAENNEETAEHVFCLLFNSVKPYFKEERSK